MNIILIVNDTFRRDHIAAYGDPAPWGRPGHEGEPFIHTPNLDRLAAQSAVFDRFYISSYPTVPCRADVLTGTYGFPFRGWQPLEPSQIVLPEIVRKAGFTPMMIFDTPMLGSDSYNFMRGFAGWDFIRGHHADRYVVDPIKTVLPASPHKLKNVAATHLYLRNTHYRRSEADWMVAKTLGTTMDWLERNRSREDFVLWVDMWDPHEPFDAPDFDVRRYADPAFDGEQVIYPRYGRGDYMSDAERNHVRALYAALVTLCDRWIGRLLEKIEALGLDRNTLVMFTTDHGHLFGDHDLQGKPTGPLGKLYEPTTRIPLMIRHPEGVGAGTRVPGIAQHPDLLPTILDFLGVDTPPGVVGQSLWPLIRGEQPRLRDAAVSGRYSAAVDVFRSSGRAAGVARDAAAFDGTAGADVVGEPLTYSTERWAYICTARGGGPRELYDLGVDPAQSTNVIAQRPDIAADLHTRLIGWLTDLGAAPERIDLYRDAAGGDRLVSPIEAEATVFAIHDARGVDLAFPTRAEAEQCLTGDVPAQSVRTVTFAEFAFASPRGLVHVDEQYYRAEDMV
jgi:arylsulfatase A-like enzyme